MAIPEKKASKARTHRKFYTGLDGMNYVDFEREAMERGVSTYQLAQAICTDWLEEQKAQQGKDQEAA
jgi:hypothetical protein